MSIEITSTLNTLEVGLPGHAPAGQSAAKVNSCVVDEALGIPAGVAVMRSSGNPVRGVSLPDATDFAADVDALVLSSATLGDSSGTSYSGAGFDGVYVAGAQLNPPRRVTATLASEADWDATNMTVIGTAPGGAYLRELVAIPDAGNATITTLAFFESVVSVAIPAQSGDAVGSLGLGAVDANAPVSIRGISLRSEGQTMPFVAGVADTQDAYADEDALAVIERGRVIVASETAATAGDPVYVRVVAGGSEQLGALRSSPDSTDCLLVEGWRFRTSASGSDNLCEVESL
jgi:hypothetical protein